MKVFRICFFTISLFVSANAIAQTPGDIEASLYKSYKDIHHWRQLRFDTTVDYQSGLNNANKVFVEKLKDYAARYPATITQQLDSLTNAGVAIVSSADGLFRIYSWDTWGGGTMRHYQNVFQYKVGDKTQSITGTEIREKEGGGSCLFNQLYAMNVKGKPYYLAIYGGVYSTRHAGQGIKIFTVENDTLNYAAKLIKTDEGMQSGLFYSYNSYLAAHLKVRPAIFFDPRTKTVFVPVVNDKGALTGKYTAYKFTGAYFEKVKS
ncbi:hypothetical protein BH09BAC6_BH09BAC6_28690 [soil metagenome]